MSAPSTPASEPEGAASGLAVEVSSRPPPGWDAFVADAPGASFAHLAAWGGVFQDVLRLEPLYLWATEGGEPRGALPLVVMPNLAVRPALVSMPYLNYGGPAGAPGAREALLEAAVEVARERRAALLEVRAREAVPGDLPGGREKVTVVLDLPDEPRVLFEDRFRSKLRSQVRRPMKAGFETRFGPGHLDGFFDVFAENMRDLGTPVLPRRLFRALLDRFPDRIEVGVVYDGETPVAGGVGFHWRDELEMTWASSLRAYSREAPNMLLYWSFMERAIGAGRARFNFGRCTPGGGTHRFKRQWGGEDEALDWRQWPAAAGPPDAASPLFRAATSLWQRLPRPVADRVGPLVARRIPTY